MMKKIVMVMLLPTTLVANAYAGTVSDSLRTTLYYRSGYSLLELSYMDNAAKLETLKQGSEASGTTPTRCCSISRSFRQLRRKVTPSSTNDWREGEENACATISRKC